MSSLPIVAIVGRPNVGKSALFNCLVQKRIAIVHDQPGITRDRLVADCLLGSRPFVVVDTGGIESFVDDDYDEQIRSEADLAMEMADVIVLVGDSRDGVTPVDRSLAKELRSARKPVILAVNKIDHPKHELADTEFSVLGFSDIVPISAAHGRGITDLVEQIERHLPEPALEEAKPDPGVPIKLAIVGRPNVGKSSLINAILQNQRTIVSDAAGTTRDSVDVPYERDGKPFVLIDTAGMRARRKHNTSVEVFSVMRAEKSIARADICALVVDALEGVTAQDKKIAGLIQENHKPCIVIVNKLDLVKPTARVRDFIDTLLQEVRANLFFLSYAPIDLVSARTGENLDRLFESIERIQQHATRSIGTGSLNRLLQEAMAAAPPPIRGNKRFKLLYATQIDKTSNHLVAPPTFVFFVNDPELLTDDYRRYLEARIRERNGYYGLPIIVRLRSRH
ncbi:MAG TPA: ribosome biogenesis GTPase Der [Chthoniobacterales bacterium]|jgi:GTP-binding protein|nr:ribosome biogenesis GTPase Der [Chthoniobacterales bacterium]